MKLTLGDKKYLREKFHENEQAIQQIEACIPYTKFTLYTVGGGSRRIYLDEVIRLLGRELFLSAMDRCAFHRTALVDVNPQHEMLFDANKYFRV